MYRFVHAADLHLDSPFRGMLVDTPNHAERLRRATFETFDRIVDFCIDEAVDGLLVAGDVFDSAEPELGAELKFRDGLIRLAEHGIRSFVCHGNHDPLDGWRAGLDWPAEVHRFGAVPEGVPLNENDDTSPLIFGVSYPTRDVRENLVPLFPSRDSNRPAIGLLHANVGSNPEHGSYAPCTIDDLVRTGYDYWALGHVHTRVILRGPDDGAPVIVYPGNAQGRHPNETGPRGVYLVEMDHNGVVAEPQFKTLDVIRWESIQLTIDGMDDEQDLIDALEGEVRAVQDSAENRPLVYRIQIEGRGSVHTALGHKGFLIDIQEKLNDQFANRSPFALCVSIIAATAISINREELAQGGDFVADLLALIDSVQANPSELQKLADEAGLPALYGHNRARRYLADSTPDDTKLASLVSDAERLLLNGLVDEEAL